MVRISENELILPALMLLADAEAGLTTTQLIAGLAELLHPSGPDLEILAGRSDTRFSQKVRNLTSHRTLSNLGLATRAFGGRNVPYIITDQGRELYEAHADALATLTDFTFTDAGPRLRELADNQPVVVIDDLIVSEGALRTRTTEYRTRSSQLRTRAIEHYAQDGQLSCTACAFDFSQAYPGIGEGFIHIHHLKPVSFLQGEPVNIGDALANVRPLCANCHQMVHTRKPPLSIAELQLSTKVRYQYV